MNSTISNDINIDVEFGVNISEPSTAEIQIWACAALKQIRPDAQVCIRVVDKDEMIELNGNYRQKPQPTNVLSFPADIPKHLMPGLLGDIAICAEVVVQEAKEQQKDHSAHWAHMVVHGCLHLAGHDHIEESEADIMESLEIDILASLGYPNPYQLQNDVGVTTFKMNN